MKKKNDNVTPQNAEKMTIYEYEQKYTKRQNVRGAKLLLRFLAAAIGILIFGCLLLIALKVVEIFEDQTAKIIAGSCAGAVGLLIFIFLYIVPLVKILKSDYFITNVNAYTAAEAKKHNKKVRRNISEKIIEFTSKVEGAGWYNSEVVGELAICLNTGDDEGVKMALTQLYSDSVKKSAKSLITKSALKSAMYSAISQTSRVDSLLVAVLNLQLIKDITFLYGFRPSDAKLVKIFGRVLQNSLIAYGLGGVKLGNSIVKTMGDAVRGIPLLGSAISAIVDSSVQGLTNGVLTAVIGYQTIKYLNEEYRLQDILDGVEVCQTEQELQETCVEIEKELKRGGKANPAIA